MKYLITFSLSLLITTLLFGQEAKLPEQLITAFKDSKLNGKYKLQPYLKPAYLEADFNGDGITDVAALIVEKKTQKGGILLIHGHTHQWFVFGAGTDFGYGSADFSSWLRKWMVYKGRTVEETTFNKENDITGSRLVRLKRPALSLLMQDDSQPSPVATIYWNGKKYIWIHQGE